MNLGTLIKVLLASAPVFIISLFLYLQLHQNFQAHYAVENIRFEKEFNQAWKSMTGDDLLKDDKFFEEQEKEAEKLWKSAQAKENDTETVYSQIRNELYSNDTEKGEEMWEMKLKK